jgi:pimeloyl-ACP methyl ester carboxylesterase
MTKPIERRVNGDGVELQLYEWPGSDPAVLLVHATGFHSRTWDQVVANLPGRHVFALDMRGHGRSDKPELPYDWALFGHDVVAAARELRLRGALGVGHSMGGHSVASAALADPSLFGSLLLVDPVLAPPRPALPRADGGEHFVARRRDRWHSPGEMFERFSSRPPFNSWEPAALRDYCEFGLLPASDGDGYVLACPPAVEAAVYAGAGRSFGDVWERLAAIEVPVRVLRARPRDDSGTFDMSMSPTPPELASRFPRGEDVPLPHLSHYIPMEAPALVAEHIAAMLDGGTGVAPASLE